jgi:hypothetical protein
MKIQLGEVSMVENKTKKYLLPCLKAYGDEFTKRIATVWKVAIGIGDIVTIKSNINFEKHIFILCETKKDIDSFLRFLDWIKEHDMYEDDYAFDNINDGCLHMLVIKLPEKFYDAYETFKKSEFSHMYSKEDLEIFFKDKPDIVKILIRDHNYKLEFSKFLEKEYGVQIPVTDIDDTFEFDLPISEYEEIFNTDLN